MIKELIDVSKHSDGGYVSYVWNKPTTGKLAHKISYAKSFKPYSWMIGSGVYIDDIENVLKEKKSEYKQKITKYIIQIAMFVSVLFLSSVVISNYFTFLIEQDIALISDTLQNISINYENIDIDKIYFKEFKLICLNINLMINELKELNLNLENKVDERTKKLQASEQYATSLVKAQDKFIKNAIHEINTPLSIIITNIDLFKLKYENNKYLTKIEAGAKIIHNIYNDLEYMVKKDRIEYKKEFVNLSKFTNERVDFFKEIALGNGLGFNLEIENGIKINFNPILLQRLIDNTLSNAIKYSLFEKDIIVKLYKKDDDIFFEITNTSNTLKDPNKIFERFYREDAARGGFGIGLSIIKEICDKNNVKVNVISNEQLTTFSYNFKLTK